MNSPDEGRSSAEPPGAETVAQEPAAELATSQDRFYGGRFELLQPIGRGYRSGLDALLLAAALEPQVCGRLADLGSGAGAVGLAALCRCPDLDATLVEKNEAMAECARRSLGLAANEPLSGRGRLVIADILAGKAARERAGLPDGGFDHVLTNPPYNPPAGRRSPDDLRDLALAGADAHSLERWFRVSAALLRHGGTFATILRADALGEVLSILQRYVGGIRILPVHSKPDAPAIRVLINGNKGSRAPVAVLPAIVLQETDGGESLLAASIAAGTASLAFGNA